MSTYMYIYTYNPLPTYKLYINIFKKTHQNILTVSLLVLCFYFLIFIFYFSLIMSRMTYVNKESSELSFSLSIALFQFKLVIFQSWGGRGILPTNETLLGLFLSLHSRIFGCPETLLSLDEIKCLSYLHFSLVKLSNWNPQREIHCTQNSLHISIHS